MLSMWHSCTLQETSFTKSPPREAIHEAKAPPPEDYLESNRSDFVADGMRRCHVKTDRLYVFKLQGQLLAVVPIPWYSDGYLLVRAPSTTSHSRMPS
jgi:hypothetical protein